MLANAVMQALTQSTALSIRDFRDLLVKPLAFGHFALQRKGSVTDTLIELAEQCAQFVKNDCEGEVGSERHSCIPNSHGWNTRRQVRNHPNDDAQNSDRQAKKQTNKPCPKRNWHQVKKRERTFVTGSEIDVTNDTNQD